MSFGVDVNILLYASDRSSPLHDKSAAFVHRCARGREVFCLAWITVMGYLRMATQPSIFAKPLSHSDAMRHVQALLSIPSCRVIAEEEEFWNVYAEVTQDVPTRGNRIPDAHFAALFNQHGVVKLYTHDKDFRRFSCLDVHDR